MLHADTRDDTRAERSGDAMEIDNEGSGQASSSKKPRLDKARKAKSQKQGTEALPLEDGVFNSLQEKFDDVYAVEAEMIMAGHSRTAATLQAHSDNLFQGALKAGYRTKLGRWLMYLKNVYPDRPDIVNIGSVSWPPSLECWKAFLWKARQQVSSYGSFTNAVVNICWLASRCFCSATGLPVDQIDPRRLNLQEHLGTTCLIRHEYGTSVKQVEAVTIKEALNAPHYADIESVRGVSMCAAFTMGALMGGRRPHTLTAIQLRDLKLTVGECDVDGQVVKVPCLDVTSSDEKFMNLQGNRKANDRPPYSGYASHIWNNPAYWIYRQLVMRGCFTCFDPALIADVGGEIN